MTEIGGVDYSSARPSPALLARDGFSFVMRYVSNSPAKNLSAGELAALRGAGLTVGLVWETTANRVLSGAAGGAADGAAAAQQAAAVGYPSTAVIFFAVDYDAQAGDFPTIGAYAAAFDGACANPVGIYGGFAVVERFVTPGRQPVAYGWQTAAWSGGRLSVKAHLFQRAQPMKWPAVPGCDENVLCLALPLAGSSPAPAPAPAPPPPAPGGTVTTLTDADAQLVALHVWGFLVSGGTIQAQDRLDGIDTGWLPNLTSKVDALAAQVAALPNVGKVDALAGEVATLAAQVAALQSQLAALPSRLPGMACQGRPVDVLKAIGAAATAGAAGQ